MRFGTINLTGSVSIRLNPNLVFVGISGTIGGDLFVEDNPKLPTAVINSWPVSVAGTRHIARNLP